MNADSRPGERRGRRVSCTVALAVAGALAAVTLGAGTMGDLFRSGDDGHSNDGAAQPPAATGGPSPSGTPRSEESPPAGSGAVGTLPKAFTGTWKGPVTERSGLPHGNVTAVFTEGKKGQDVVRLTYALEVLGTKVVCRSIGRLVSGEATAIEVRERTDPDGTDATLCTGGESDLDFTLTSGSTLLYRSHEDAAGTPKGVLTRSGG
jgi:hypothetical protein